MKRKKNQTPERFQKDKYADGPKKPKLKAPRSTWDDENLDEALDEWLDMRDWQSEEE